MFRPAARLALALAAAAVPAALPAADPAPKRYAVLVGVNRYEHPGLAPLKYAENDVVKLRDVLKGAGYQVTLLTGKDATRAAVLTALKGVVDGCRGGDTLVVGLAGHGLQFERDKDSYFCPVDARPLKERADTLVSIARVYADLEGSFAGVKLVLVDACRDDPKAGRGVNADTAPPPPRGVGVLLSCSAGERAFEHGTIEHGVFFHHVLQGLQGKALDDEGNVTWDSLRGYVKRQVAREVPVLIGGGAKQQPNETGNLSGAPPVLVDAAARPRAPFDAAAAKAAQKAWAARLGRTSPIHSATVADGVVMDFALIPPGTFRMGSPKDEPGRAADEHPHEVAVDKPFYLGRYEVTVREFRAFAAATGFRSTAEGTGDENTWKKPTFDQPTDRHPVTWMTSSDARAFCDWLGKKEGKKYRLPTEAEWEWACRAGTNTRYWFGNDPDEVVKYENVADQSYDAVYAPPIGVSGNDGYAHTAPVGSFRPNPWGLFDMHGNVLEWCSDAYRPAPGAAATGHQVIRGGAWGGGAAVARSARRSGEDPAIRSIFTGFRVCLDAE